MVYTEGAFRIGKLYAPAVAVGAISIAALSGSHVILTRRNAALTAAYAAVSKAYVEYRARVEEQLGEDKERMIYHAAEVRELVDPDNPDGKKIKEVVADPTRFSPYARFFDEASPDWQKDAELNRYYIQCQQNYANHLLQARGHVFLNEVYDMLGIERSKAGQVVGWLIGGDGDNYIDFGMFEARNSEFINGNERCILLDFNVDGVIYDQI
jgi:hypothetical protein